MLKLFLMSILVLFTQGAEKAYAQPAELMLAARNGDIDEVSALLASGAEPDPKGIATPLYFAAQGGHREITRLLLDRGADPNAQSNWGTPLQIAARRGHFDVVTSLLQSGAETNAVGGEFGYSPLHEVAETGNVDIGKLLIAHGADVNIRNKRFEPPIHLAVLKNKTAFADLMRDAGATPIAVNQISEELADADLGKGRLRAVECLNCHKLEKGADAVGSYGPWLWDIVGREVAIASEREKFPYSEVMMAQSGVWTYERLNEFLADPYGRMPGTGMYRGLVRDRTERINLIAYLRTLSDDPIPLP
jgi:cytochrome c